MRFTSPQPGRLLVCVAFGAALSIAGGGLRGETAGAPAAPAGSDPSKRLEWLNAHLPTPVPAPPAPKAVGPTKVKFRANPIAPRSPETPPAEPRPAEPPPVKPAELPSPRTFSSESRLAKATPAPAKAAPPAVAALPSPAKNRSADVTSTPAPKAKPTPAIAAVPPAPPKPTPVAVVAAPSPAKVRTAEAHSTPLPKATPTPAVAALPPSESRPKSTPAAPAKPTPAPVVAAPSPAKVRTAETRSTPLPKATPAPVVAANPPAKATPPPPAKPAPPAVVAAPSPAKVRVAEVRATPAPKPTPAPVIEVASIKSQPARTSLFSQPRTSTENRYPWKSDIVTTVFWIGEPVGGHNFTPNFASSWDPHWTAAYGGFDTPDPNARRNFIPVKFTPRQNPFYVALPYNDVTRGTTKPEARLVIPWFKEAFQHEGESVCRDRWVAVRNRAGKVGYAQWSDCGPFRTDHWQYVFGNEKPKPNLNKGAGLDVSPALRDFLGLGGTDVTDWKFVDARDVPNGPWALYGDNNLLARRGANPQKNTVKETSRPATGVAALRVSKL
ncbi:MAG TPA: hypothetical protein VGO11_27400 [Chthoniobacteraceae bacterium]|nr:hypothetical protein [Chthoniobacteraceae bacterium]